MEGKRAADDSQDKFEKKSHMVCSHASNNSLPQGIFLVPHVGTLEDLACPFLCAIPGFFLFSIAVAVPRGEGLWQ